MKVSRYSFTAGNVMALKEFSSLNDSMIHAGAQSSRARSYLAQEGLTSWREDAMSYPGASLLEEASPNSWRYKLTGTDCAGKHNKP